MTTKRGQVVGSRTVARLETAVAGTPELRERLDEFARLQERQREWDEYDRAHRAVREQLRADTATALVAIEEALVATLRWGPPAPDEAPERTVLVGGYQWVLRFAADYALRPDGGGRWMIHTSGPVTVIAL